MVYLGRINNDDVILIALGRIQGMEPDTVHIFLAVKTKGLHGVDGKLVLNILRAVERKQQYSGRFDLTRLVNLLWTCECLVLEDLLDEGHCPLDMHGVERRSADLSYA